MKNGEEYPLRFFAAITKQSLKKYFFLQVQFRLSVYNGAIAKKEALDMQATKLLSLLVAVALIVSLTGCGAGKDNASNAGASDGVYEADTTFNFTSGGITAQGGSEGYEIDGSTLTITGAGTYALTGSCSDGSVSVKKGTTGVTLVLNGLSLTSSDTAPIICGKSTEVTIAAVSGSKNSLADSSANNSDDNPDNTNAESAVIKCKDGSKVTLCGSGELSITANGKNGIKSGATTDSEGEASLTIKELTLDISVPVNDAINAQQLLNLESGSITVSAGDDAVHCDLIMNVGAQDTDGPEITVTRCSKGLEAAQLNILSGSIDIVSSDDCLNAANSDLSDYDFSINISGGSISAYSADGDGFDSNGDLNISGGTVAVWTASRADDQPLDADGTVTVSGGTVFAAGGSSGMGLSLSAQQPCVTFASDSDTARLAKSGAQVFVKASDGKELFTADAPCDAAFVFFSAAELSDGEDADLYSGTDEVATAAVQSGSVSVGNAGGGMGGMRPGGSPGNAGAEPPQGGAKPDGEPPQGGRPGNK